MRWEIEPVEAIFHKRYKRFFADVTVNGSVEVAHVPNTGSLKSCLREGKRALVLPSTNPERKLKWTLVALETEHGGWVGVDTSRPNRLLKEVFEQKLCGHWPPGAEFQPEVKINAQTRLDGLLRHGDGHYYIEVKNVTLADGNFAKGQGRALFPDAVTERGQKHLRELMELIEKGHAAELIFAIQRTDCVEFGPADDIDPEYGRLLREAAQKGLRISPWKIEVSPDGVHWRGQLLPVRL